MQSGSFGKWAAVVVGGLGLVLLGAAAFISLKPPSFTPHDVAEYIDAIPVDVRDHLGFDEIHSLVNEPIRSQLFEVVVLTGVGLACVVIALCCLNEIAHDLFFRIGHRMSVGLPGPGVVLIAFVIVFALVAIPISYHPTSQFFLDLAKVGFGAFLAVFIQGGRGSSDG